MQIWLLWKFKKLARVFQEERLQGAGLSSLIKIPTMRQIKVKAAF